MKFGRKNKALLGVAAILTVTALGVYAFTAYLQTTNTFTIGASLQASNLEISYNGGSTMQGCTASGASWTCPSASGDLFGGATITYAFAFESDVGAGVTPSVNVVGNGGAFTTFSFSTQYVTTIGAGSGSLGQYYPWNGGLPTTTPGQWYFAQLDIVLGANPAPGSVSLAVSFGM